MIAGTTITLATIARTTMIADTVGHVENLATTTITTGNTMTQAMTMRRTTGHTETRTMMTSAATIALVTVILVVKIHHNEAIDLVNLGKSSRDMSLVLPIPVAPATTGLIATNLQR
jgi:hypothetical protein